MTNGLAFLSGALVAYALIAAIVLIAPTRRQIRLYWQILRDWQLNRKEKGRNDDT